MKLWKISQSVEERPYFYDSAVVAATDEVTAQYIHPGSREPDEIMWLDGAWHQFSPALLEARPRLHECWVSPEHVSVEFIGETSNFVSGTVIVGSMQ